MTAQCVVSSEHISELYLSVMDFSNRLKCAGSVGSCMAKGAQINYLYVHKNKYRVTCRSSSLSWFICLDFRVI